ncbi:PAS domain S-box [Synechococcus sp. PCC 7502]|uniref:PAS domain S-box protein n=1 Tax=Synechococcus sp. PCC 7502 TaxID=1173263 RepID=UPI00029F8623|nr:PAS domain S-box protein [Synechococcus sp. PCC 7502]AFY75307.1 PAS domain S-box [Synechococcus sp. PCC 7502]
MLNLQPVILSSQISVDQAIAQLHTHNQTYAVVINPNASILGILTQTDILKAIAMLPHWQNQAIASITNTKILLQTEVPKDPSSMLKLLEQKGVSYSIVIDSEQQILGVISADHLAKYISLSPKPCICQRIIETTPNIISIYNLDIHATSYVNFRVQTILGYSLAQIIGMGAEVAVKLIHPHDLPRLNQHLEQCRSLADGETLEIEYQAKHLNGYWLWLHSRHTPFRRGEEGQVIEILGISQDITARKLAITAMEQLNLDLEAQVSDRTKSLRYINQELLAEISERKLATAALRYSEDKFRHIFEDSPIGINLVGLDGKYMQVNPAFCQMLGYEDSELRKLSVFEVTHPPNISAEKDLMSKITRGVINQYHLEKIYITKERQLIRTSQTTATIRDARDNIRFLINMVEDISDRFKAAEDLRRSEERFRKIFEDSPIGMVLLGLDQKIVKTNKALNQMLGYSELDLVKQHLNALTHPDDQEVTNRLTHYLYQGQISSYQLEQRCLAKNGLNIWVKLNTSVVKDQEHQQLLHVLIMIQDITREKESQKLIAHSLAEKELLLQEIHHRVKNNLHVIASLLELQARTSKDDYVINLFSESQNRIYSMALIHEQLCLSPQFEHIDFSEYLQKLVSNLFASYGVNPNLIQCVLEIKPITIGFQTALPCGLILNEIVSNSLKYAFIGCDRGEIQIRFSQQADILNLVISDNGVGLPPDLDWHRVNTLGLRLVKILARQLDASISLDRSNGTKFNLSFSAASPSPKKLYAHT